MSYNDLRNYLESKDGRFSKEDIEIVKKALEERSTDNLISKLKSLNSVKDRTKFEVLEKNTVLDILTVRRYR